MTALLAHADPALVFARRGGREISVGAFLADVAGLAAVLPQGRFVANLCQDRYRFAVGFAAALCRGQVTLLPPSEAAGVLAAVLGGYQDVYALTDLAVDVPVPVFAYPGHLLPVACENPAFPPDQVAAVLFTSGSTGTPAAHPRSWGLLVSAAASAGQEMAVAKGASLVGTVPHQHSYGLESLVMLAWRHGLVLQAERPFYASDITSLLADLPRPRVLVTTPVHLRLLLAEAGGLPPADLVISATAPLELALAEAAEAAFAAPLHEIYGCSEAGQLASRRPSRRDEWRCLDGISLRQDGSATLVSADGVETALGDIIELSDSRHFRLLGRNTDMVNIAGKRSSLASLNAQLQAVADVVDGVFTWNAAGTRLEAFVVAPGLTAENIRAALRGRIDPAFMPRRVRLVQSLPRNPLGKLTCAALTALQAAV